MIFFLFLKWPKNRTKIEEATSMINSCIFRNLLDGTHLMHEYDMCFLSNLLALSLRPASSTSASE